MNWHQLRMQALPEGRAVFLLCVLPLVVELSFPALVFAVLGTAYFIRRLLRKVRHGKSARPTFSRCCFNVHVAHRC